MPHHEIIERPTIECMDIGPTAAEQRRMRELYHFEMLSQQADQTADIDDFYDVNRKLIALRILNPDIHAQWLVIRDNIYS
jgi:hypothetical protein